MPRPQLDNWPRLTATFLGTHTYPGDHFYLTEHRERLTDTITATVRAQLGREGAPEAAVPGKPAGSTGR